jgi:hypothetical protein
MKLNMSDFRTSLNLGHLRNATEKLDKFSQIVEEEAVPACSVIEVITMIRYLTTRGWQGVGNRRCKSKH